jgi:hypothetical protein
MYLQRRGNLHKPLDLPGETIESELSNIILNTVW